MGDCRFDKIDFGFGVYFRHIKMTEAWRQKGRIQTKLQRILDEGTELIIIREDMQILRVKDGKFIVDTKPLKRYLKRNTTAEWFNENTRVTMTDGI